METTPTGVIELHDPQFVEAFAVNTAQFYRALAGSKQAPAAPSDEIPKGMYMDKDLPRIRWYATSDGVVRCIGPHGDIISSMDLAEFKGDIRRGSLVRVSPDDEAAELDKSNADHFE